MFCSAKCFKVEIGSRGTSKKEEGKKKQIHSVNNLPCIANGQVYFYMYRVMLKYIYVHIYKMKPSSFKINAMLSVPLKDNHP